MNNREFAPFQIRKSNKQDDHLVVIDSNGDAICAAHAAVLRKLAKAKRGRFTTPTVLRPDRCFILSTPFTEEDYPELVMNIKLKTMPTKDNNMNTVKEMSFEKDNGPTNETFTTGKNSVTYQGTWDASQKEGTSTVTDKDGAVSSSESIDYSKYYQPSGIPTPDSPEVQAYSTPVNQRHRFLNEIKVVPISTNIGGTYYQIEAYYRGETQFLESQFSATLKVTLTLAEYESGISLKEGKWQADTTEKWLGHYEMEYKEWKNVITFQDERRSASNSVMTREESSSWDMHYHHTPIEAINYIMSLNPQHSHK